MVDTMFRTADQTDTLRVYINPKIVHSSKEESVIYEGCGSAAHREMCIKKIKTSVAQVSASKITLK